MKAIRNWVYSSAGVVLVLLTIFIIARKNGEFDEVQKVNGFGEEAAIAGKTEGVNGSEDQDPKIVQGIPVVELIPVETAGDLLDFSLEATPIRKRRFITESGMRVELDLKEDSEILSVVANPTGNQFLVAQGSPRTASIYNSDGKFVTLLPTVDTALPDLRPHTQFDWKWSGGERFVATLGFIHEVIPNQYPDESTRVYDIRLYSYAMESERLVELRLPSEIKMKKIMKFVGTDREGNLALSLIPIDQDYNQESGVEEIAYFAIPE